MHFTKLAVALVAGIASVNAHIAMQMPVPYGNPDTSPLSPSGSNYPCKTDNGFTVNSVTTMKVGDTQQLSFKGTAVHNGGSCQLSVTPGHTPTTDSQFKVILSIEGGCPGTDGATTSYNFQIPQEVPAGDYSLAWTWYNNIGNREIYMNCAPITVSGGSGTQSTLGSLPDMAIFNIPSKNACGTAETFDVQFPNPGKYVQTGSGFKPAPPTNCGAVVPSSGSTGGGSSGGSSGSAPSAPASKPSTAKPAIMASATATTLKTTFKTTTVGGAAPSGGVFGEGSSNGTTPASTAILVSAAPASTGSVSTPAGGYTTQTCSSDGALVCSSDGTQQGLCNFGKVMLMPVAAGTKCVNGAIQKRSLFSA